MNTQDYYRCFNQCLDRMKTASEAPESKRIKSKLKVNGAQMIANGTSMQKLSVDEYIEKDYPFYYLTNCNDVKELRENGLHPDDSGTILVFRSLGRIQTVIGPECINLYRIIRISPKKHQISSNDIYEAELPEGYDILVNYIKKDCIRIDGEDILQDICIFEPDDLENSLKDYMFLDGYKHSKIKYGGSIKVNMFGSYLEDSDYETWDNSFRLKNNLVSLQEEVWDSVDKLEETHMTMEHHDVIYYCCKILFGEKRIDQLIKQATPLLFALDDKTLNEIGNKYVQRMRSAIEQPLIEYHCSKDNIREMLSTCGQERLEYNHKCLAEMIQVSDLIDSEIRLFADTIHLSLSQSYNVAYDSLNELFPDSTDLDGIAPKKVGFWQNVLWFLEALARS